MTILLLLALNMEGGGRGVVEATTGAFLLAKINCTHSNFHYILFSGINFWFLGFKDPKAH